MQSTQLLARHTIRSEHSAVQCDTKNKRLSDFVFTHNLDIKG